MYMQFGSKGQLISKCPFGVAKSVIEGQLKEKKGGRCSLFKKWKSCYFTLSGDKLTVKDTVSHGLLYIWTKEQSIYFS